MGDTEACGDDMEAAACAAVGGGPIAGTVRKTISLINKSSFGYNEMVLKNKQNMNDNKNKIKNNKNNNSNNNNIA